MKTTNVTQESLTKMWKTYINDSSIFSKQSFGKYVHDRIMVSGYCWPKLYYAKSDAYDIVHRHIHKNDNEGIRRVL